MDSLLLRTTLLTVGMLTTSNLFMTFAWYGHLRTMQQSPWWVAALASWGIALAEYLIMVPANRLGYAGGLSGAQLKMLQECVTLLVFVPFMTVFLGEKWKWDYLWAFSASWGRCSSSSVRTGVETPPAVWCIIHDMKTSLLALLAAVTLASAATTTTTANKKTTGGTSTGETTATTADKKKTKKEESAAKVADPVSLVADSVDAATQIAMEAAKAAQAEAAKLAAIGSDKTASPSNAKLAEAAVVGGVTAAKELKKAKKEADEDKKSEDKKPETKPTAKKAAKEASAQ